MYRSTLLLTLLLSCFFLQAQVRIIPQPGAEEEAFYTRAMLVARPEIKNWIYNKATECKLKDINEAALKSSAKSSFNNLQDADVEALVMLVMMRASKDMGKDLKEQMENVKKTNEDKAALREIDKKHKSAADSNKRTLDPRLKSSVGVVPVATKKDNMTDMSEQNQLKLQVNLDRRNKMMTAISNIMKKISSTQDSIIKNLK